MRNGSMRALVAVTGVICARNGGRVRRQGLGRGGGVGQ